MRKRFVGGNWKMNTTLARARDLAAAVVKGVGREDRVTVAVCPPFPYLPAVSEVLRGSPVVLGAQNMYFEKEGAFTGEVSSTMLLDVGCKFVILGHSERRHKLGESDALVNRKVHAALAAGLFAVVCVGELLEERQGNRTEDVLCKQLSGSLAGLDGAGLARVVVAYEPIWAIGTGQTATPEQAQSAHAYIRGQIAARFGEEASRRLPIAYGGSVTDKNVAALLAEPDVDGGLIGGASLKAEEFLAIVRAAL
jgi:triosephosphate isomerase (TIM)